ncbi:lantibiotic dehydratase [Kitasatospora sp. NPDC050467]|uniref:lantibiotic dehydratase n=1 Tax=Kitasatospora sp. NPDC050467 TaxID=3364053 RepID=UPI0037A48D56
MGARTAASTWTLLPHFLLRRAGFPFDLLAVPDDDPTVPAVERLVESVRRMECERHALLRREIPAEVERLRRAGDDGTLLRPLSRCRSALGRRRDADAAQRCAALPGRGEHLGPALDRFVAAARDVELARTRVAATLEHSARAEEERLLLGLGHDRVREALVQLSPSFAEHAARLTAARLATARLAAAQAVDGQGPARARDRKFLRTAYLYVQRLAAKNETTSFFGPLTHGRFTPEHQGYAGGPETDSGVRRNDAFLAFWATAELARVIAADPRLAGRIPVRRTPLVAVLDDGVRDPHGRVRRLGALDRAILTAADGADTADALARRLAAERGVPHQDVRDRVERLAGAGLLLADLEPASARPQPLDDLRVLVAAADPGSPWLVELDALRKDLRRYANTCGAPERERAFGELESRFGRLTGVDARRSGGQMYADRLVAYEECEGDAPLTIGADVADRWSRDLAPYLDLCAAYGALRYRSVRAEASRVLAAAGGELPYLEFADRLAEATAATASRRDVPAERVFEERLAAVVAAAADGNRARLAPADLRTLIDSVEPDDDGPTSARFVSPDLMLARAGADELLVLGEMHPYVFAWGSQGLFAPDAEALQADLARDLTPWGGPERIATVLRRRQHKGLVSEAFPGRFVEISGLATRERDRCVAVADLRVVTGPSGPELHGPGGQLVLYTGENDHPHLRAFAPPQVEPPPVRLGGRRPRVSVGDVVVQRARWWLSAQDLEELRRAADGPEAVVAVATLRARSGIPRHVFVKPAGEPKPVCLDLSSPLAVSVLRVFSGGDLVVEEMLPAPDQLWLERQAGRHTSEFRLAMIGRGDA